MKINSEFDRRVVVHSTAQQWLESPMAGVFRRPLDRVGAELARATSIVKYMPNSQFSPHIHTGGEEFLILDGVFQDEHGDYPAGSYVRNPPESRHTPGSALGCVMFVKLWQFRPDDRQHVNLDSNSMQTVAHEHIENVSLVPLYNDEYEDVSIEYWEANSKIVVDVADGLEILVLEGSFIEGEDALNELSWLRLPRCSSLNVRVGANGAKVWVKRNHLRSLNEQIQRLSNFS